MEKSTLGYNKQIFILAFDHRSSFIKKMFGWEGALLPDQQRTVADYKMLIYEGFKKGVELGVPKDNAALLVEEEFGDAVLRDAKEQGFSVILTTEKSGQDEFDFQYGGDFQDHIEKYHPTFTKALVRYNPEGDPALNARQRDRLKSLSDYSHSGGYKFLIEPLIPATPEQLLAVGGDKKRYDEQFRPALAVRMIKELQDAGVEPDIWKIEGMADPKHYQDVVTQAKSGGRDQVGIVVLGRGESVQNVEIWLKAGAKTDGVLGFAIGRTIFWQALEDYRGGKIGRQQALEAIGGNYFHFYQVFINQ